MLWFIVIAQAVICGGFCAFIASQKNREAASWFLLGFLCSIFALIAVAAIPALHENARKADQPGSWAGISLTEDQRADEWNASSEPNRGLMVIVAIVVLAIIVYVAFIVP